MNICVIGGDKRMATVAEKAAADGCRVISVGLDNHPFSTACLLTNNLSVAIASSDIIILPLPVTRDKVNLFAPLSRFDISIDEVLEADFENKTVLGGLVSDDLKRCITEKGGNFYDYFLREELCILNSVSTIEGAIEIAMRETDITVWGSRVLVVGYGRLGKVAAEKFSALGASVSVSARRESDLAWIKVNGYRPLKTHELFEHIAGFDIIINTVPFLVIDEKEIKNANRDSVIIDLASIPGGVNFEAARKEKIKAIHALSLPGKVAPKSAGLALYDTIMNILFETKKPT